jgi:hypothetical protein
MLPREFAFLYPQQWLLHINIVGQETMKKSISIKHQRAEDSNCEKQ